jgi:hypothetical protein
MGSSSTRGQVFSHRLTIPMKMKHFLIKYHFTNGSVEEWHREIARFIEALENDPVVGVVPLELIAETGFRA